MLAASSLNVAAALPKPAGEKPLRIVFYTDLHTRTEWGTPVALAQVADRINALQPDLVLCGGDMVTDGFQARPGGVDDRWEAYLKLHRAIKAPLHAVPGNHDLVGALPEDGSAAASDPRAEFKERMGVDRTWRSFDQGGIHFILFDSVQIDGKDRPYRGRIDDSQLAWLEDDLARVSETTPTVAVSHIPFLSVFSQATKGATEPTSPGRIVENSREVLKRFQKHRLVAVLQGHLHVNADIRWQNTRFITGGAVCAKWWRGPWHGTEEGFGLLSVSRDGAVHWQYIDYGWEARRPVGE